MRWAISLTSLAILVGTASTAIGQDDCGYRWSDRFGTYDFNGSRPSAAQVFDEDGDGPRLPALFVGGSFSNMRLHPSPIIEGTRNIARWDGARWTSVGGGAPDYVGWITGMTVFDQDGPGPEPEALYVAPTLTGGCARWDGAVWANCNHAGMPPNYEIKHLATFDDDGAGPNAPVLIAAAWCIDSSCFKGRVYRLADGAWSQMGGTFNDYLFDFETFDADGDGPNPPRLIVAGGFDNVTPPLTPANNVAQWDGSAWQPLGAGTNLHVKDLLVCDLDDDGPQTTQLFAAGSFTMAGGIAANYIASWDGNAWSPLGSGLNDRVSRIAFFRTPNSKGHLYAFGSFTQAGGQNVFQRFAAWDGYNWERPYTANTSAPSFQIFGDGPQAIVEFDPDGSGLEPPMLYTFGGASLTQPPVGGRTPYDGCKWNGENWYYLSSGVGIQFYGIELMKVWDVDGGGPEDGNLVIGGGFSTAGDILANQLATLSDDDWACLDLGENSYLGTVRAFGTWDSDGLGPRPSGLVMTGYFHGGGYQFDSQAIWDGISWQSLPGVEHPEFINEARSIVAWDHDGDPLTPDNLVIAGDCYFAPFRSTVAVVWNGVEWAPLWGDGLDCGQANCIIPVDRDGAGGQSPVLFVGASGPIFQDFDAQEYLHYLGWWDGARWQPLGLPPNGEVLVLLYDDPDGAGPSQGTLYVGGRFTEIGGITANRIAAYDFDTETWRALGSIGSEGYLSVNALAIFDEDEDGPLPPYLVAGGYFDVADGMQVNSIAKWDGTSWSDLDNGLLISGTGTDIGQVSSLAVLPGTQSDPYPKLFVGGYMERAGNVGTRNIACWTKVRPPEAVMLSSDTIVTAGSKVVLRASALGDDPITYQWRRNGVPLSDDGRITGSDKAILRIMNVDRPDEGSYDVVATNHCSESVSTVAGLIVPCFTARPDGDLNGDGQLDGRDIQLIVDYLVADTQTTAVVCRVDFDNSRRLDLADIAPFTEKLLAP